MRFSYTLVKLVELLRPKRVVGNTEVEITEVGSLADARSGCVSFLGNMKYRNEVQTTNASVVLLPPSYENEPKDGQCFLFFDNPSLAIGLLCRDIERKCALRPALGIHGTAVVDDTASIGSGVSVGPNVVICPGATISDGVVIMAGCYIGKDAKIGEGSILRPSVVVMDFCEIGKRVTLSPGVVIGADGFGYETVDGVHEKIPQLGNVIIGDDVEIGANATVDRARFSCTKIGRGTKIDNLVQIGHNVTIGDGCIIIAQTGISGSTTIGNHVVIGGQVGIAGHLHIPDGVMIAGKSSVASYKSGRVLRGNPSMPINEMNRIYVLMRQLPELFARVSSLEKGK
jgi:UDP-3-O-[3-hydroxymyristoyl] glucosamine N-acyltransferase